MSQDPLRVLSVQLVLGVVEYLIVCIQVEIVFLIIGIAVNANNTINQCLPCAPNSYCPLGSIGDTNISHYQSKSQAFPYPNAPPSTNYADIIVTNAFQLNGSSRACLIRSPLFWTFIVLGIVALTYVILSILYLFPKTRKPYDIVKRILKHTDLIGEGELWIGGLVSFALIVLIIYAFWFGSVYINQYPIETSADSNFACDQSLRNAKFSSSLQLLALIKSEEEKPIFDLLDQQNWTLSIDFIQTGFQCDQIVIKVSLIVVRMYFRLINFFFQG